MSYIGNTSTTQAFSPVVDYASGNGSTTAFTLSRPVASVAQVQVTVANVPQNPTSAYTISGQTLTFTSAPPSGTNNIYVYYTSPITQTFAPAQGTVNTTSFASSTGTGAGVFQTSPTITTPVISSLSSASSTALTLQSAGTTAVTIDTSQNVGIGTSSPPTRLGVQLSSATTYTTSTRTNNGIQIYNSSLTTNGYTGIEFVGEPTSGNGGVAGIGSVVTASGSANLVFGTRDSSTYAERMRIKSNGSLLVATTTEDVADANGVGATFNFAGNAQFSRASGGVVNVNRKTDDGTLVYFQQDATVEGTISVSGTTVSYNGGHLSRYAQTTTAKDESILKGTVLSNLDAMNVYTDAEGNPVANEQLNKVKVSDVEGDANVAGVFVNWSYDEQHSVDEINMAMTGDMIIRIAQGVTVVRGDLLMSAGNGTAKPQGDDIVRSKTVAKVTSNHVTCTYADGSYCVPCVLMAC